VTDAALVDVMSSRINISPDELLITENGMFLLKSDDALPLTAVFADAEGLFIIDPVAGRLHNECLNGHPLYHQECRGCANWWCVFRCKCHSPWAMTNN